MDDLSYLSSREMVNGVLRAEIRGCDDNDQMLFSFNAFGFFCQCGDV